MFTLNQEDLHPPRTPARSVKLFKSRAFNDENNSRFYPGTVKKSMKTKPIAQRSFLAGKIGGHSKCGSPCYRMCFIEIHY